MSLPKTNRGCRTATILPRIQIRAASTKLLMMFSLK
jgi:hypothetical protein